MYLIFDTETNSNRIRSIDKIADELDKWPRITQLSWQLYNSEQILIHERDYFIKPDGWTIPTDDPFFIDNKMSTEKCEEHGFPIDQVLAEFITTMVLADFLIAHNERFDRVMVKSELFRLGQKDPLNEYKWPEMICTMKQGKEVAQAKNKKGHPKNPNLKELYKALFFKDFANAHDASADTQATADCFFALLNRGVIQIKQANETTI